MRAELLVGYRFIVVNACTAVLVATGNGTRNALYSYPRPNHYLALISILIRDSTIFPISVLFRNKS